MKSNWKNLQDLLFFQEGPGVRKNQFKHTGVKLLNVGNINDKKLNLDTTSIFISEEEAFGKYSHFLVEDGDLLICCSGIVVDNFHNKIVFAEEKHLPLCLNTSTMRFRTLNEDILNIKYFYYFLMTRLFKEHLQKLITGSAQLNFGPSHIKKIFMPIVKLEEQKQIAKTLDKAQELIDLRKESIAKLDELAKSMFIDMFGDPVSNEKGWDIEKLDDITTKIGSGSTPKGGKDSYKSEGISLIRSLNIHDNKFKYKDLAFIDDVQAKGLSNVIVEKNDVLLNITGASVCRCAIVPEDVLPARVNQHVAIIRTDENVNSKYLMHLFISNYKDKLMHIATAGGATREALTKENIQNLEIPLPSIDLQNKFAQIIEKIEEQKSLYEQELEKLEDNFQALLQQSFGE
ncbi:restriction endonuclease subunit S [Aliarcobacter butzleri]|uniref:restriction endonuclease subunit S n=1 Tax=Aliarcobacter butzleri TaxID=28197 RepID=UPI00125F8B95|nr:restriction endonuclease subunit S [Aliarcobacter butzleri]